MEQKSSRIQNCASNLQHEAGIIVHSRGLRSPRELSRKHACVVLENGTGATLEDIHPCKSSVH